MGSCLAERQSEKVSEQALRAKKVSALPTAREAMSGGVMKVWTGWSM